jgi:hypothetical protein
MTTPISSLLRRAWTAALPWRTGSRGAILVIVLAWAAFFLPELLGRQAIYLRDVINQYYPLKTFVARALHNGQLPLWNPFVNCGEPALANPDYMVFYPGYWLFYLFPTVYCFQLHFLLHYLIGAMGFYFLIRPHTRRAMPAVLGGLLWALNGFALSQALFQNLVTYVALLPLFLCSLRRVARRPDAGGVAALAICTACAAFAFEPNSFLFMTGAGLVYLVWLLRQKRGSLRRPASAVLAAAILTSLLAAVQVLPAWNLLGGSKRGSGLMDDRYTLRPADVLQILIPRPYGDFQTKEAWIAPLRGGSVLPFYISLYLGGVPLALALFGFIRASRWMRAGAAVVIAGGVWMALGSAGRLYPWIWHHLPLLNYGRYPIKFLLLPLLAILLLSIRGLDACVDEPAEKLGGLRLAALALVVAVAGATVWLHVLPLPPAGTGGDWLDAARPFLTPQLGIQVLLLLGLAGAAGLSGDARRRRLSVALPILVACSLWAGHSILPTIAPDRFGPGPTLAGLAGERGPAAGRISPSGRPAPLAAEARQEEFRFYAALDLNCLPLLWGFRSGLIDSPAAMEGPGKHSCIQIMRSGRAPWPVVRNVLRAQSIRYVPTLRPTGDPLAAVRELAPGVPVFLQELADPVPDLYVPRQLLPVAAGTTARELFSPRLIPGVVAFREEGPAVVYPDDGGLKILSYRRFHNRLDCTLSIAACRLVVWNESADPGWRLKIDGQPAAILTVNGFFQGFWLGEGAHRVDFTYRPAGLVAGAGLTVAGLVLLIGLAGFHLATRRRKPAPDSGLDRDSVPENGTHGV